MIINKDIYQQIVKVMPISCVDLVVVDDYGQVLLARRTNEPAKGEWWFLGGRVHFLENRVDAAVRRLREEYLASGGKMIFPFPDIEIV